MPKIIPDIDSRIEEAALSLFLEYDYSLVDMKMIAKQCHIAVGTLYNYYANKHQLFLHILRKSWEATSDALDATYEAYALPEERLSHSIEIIYDDCCERRGMVKYIYKILSGMEVHEEVTALFDIVFIKVQRLFEPFEKKSFSCEEKLMNQRLAKSLILIVQNILISSPDTREDNLHFIQDFFYNSLHVDMDLKKTYLATH